MPAAPDPDLTRMQMIMHLATLIRTELNPLSEAEFLASQNQLDLAAYRLGSVGEYGRKVSVELKEHHPHIDWRGMYNMRNALFHDYAGVLGIRLWEAACEPLAQLVEVCRMEIALRNPNPGSPDASP